MTKFINSTKNRVEVGSLEVSKFQSLINSQFKDAKKVLIVDENTQENCAPYLITAFEGLEEAEVIVLPTGEPNKVMEVCQQVWEAFTKYGIQRGDLVINLGGGVVTDMGGFIAALYKRGLRFINIPTTLLAMVDASVGGKTGVNLGPYKNQIGSFAFPEITFCDPIFLKTLPERELISGQAEMFKHAMISSKEHWTELTKTDFYNINSDLLYDSIQIKATIVDNDPTEKGLRKTLNLGHTVGHAIEGFYMDEHQYTHGECIAWGMLVEAYIALELEMIEKSEVNEIERVICKMFDEISLSPDVFETIISLMKNDKKNNSSKINFSLPTKIGAVVFDQQVEEEYILKALNTIFNKA
ncbi:MAG: 3-dehydroquinate synthase [Brumimicrobium sp.]